MARQESAKLSSWVQIPSSPFFIPVPRILKPKLTQELPAGKLISNDKVFARRGSLNASNSLNEQRRHLVSDRAHIIARQGFDHWLDAGSLDCDQIVVFLHNTSLVSGVAVLVITFTFIRAI